MPDIQQLWKPHMIKADETLELTLGALHLWIHRGMQEWHIAHETESVGETRCTLSVSESPFDTERNWTRWILDEHIEKILLKPQLACGLFIRMNDDFHVRPPLRQAAACIRSTP